MSKKVLIVEDTDDIRLMMKILLEQYGFEVVTALNGYEAIEMAHQHHPDLILMDLMMPFMDGVEAAKIIRQMDGERVPMLAVTACDENIYDNAVAAGCDGVLLKPLDFNNLQPLLQHYLN
jgi:CheY-like chemotaxis protein